MERNITGSAIRDWQLSKHSEKGVACANCHIPVKEASPGIMSTASACEDKRVRRRVSPRNCAVCHPGKFEQFSQGKHSVAWGTMISMPTTAMQPHALIEGMKGCGGCHRVGLDEGKCDSCHTRHRFNPAEARRMNPDYQHYYGWAEMNRDLAEIREEAAQLRAGHGKGAGGGR